ncbi:hypothetical protein V6N11_054203 [Hibiscus sabdariffa]|uniref:MATH domain-containing protein n=1 Tax=Hibiscus sabdariffa TaxID=183260 RepID=A0ABR2S3D1_9ROSI
MRKNRINRRTLLRSLNLLPLQVLQIASVSTTSLVNSKCGSNLFKVMWKVEILKAVVCRKSPSKDGNGEITKVTWRIENFSCIKRQKFYSEHFTVDGNKWRLSIYPKGDKGDHLSIYLEVADLITLPPGWTRYAQYGFALIDQIDRRTSMAKVAEAEFKGKESGWGFTSFLARSELDDPKRGYLLNDSCLVEAYISGDRTEGLISHKLIFETDSDKHETREADGVKAAIDNRTTLKSGPAIETEDPTDEDMNTLFSSLESKLLNSKIVVSQGAAKEALAKLDEAMNMTPVDFYNSGKFSPLKQAFKILSSFNYSSTTLTTEQKKVLLAMEESLKELADRAAKAVEDKNYFSEKESMKLTITHGLGSNVVRYKEVESEVKQVDQKLAAFHEQVEEAQKARENMLAE